MSLFVCHHQHATGVTARRPSTTPATADGPVAFDSVDIDRFIAERESGWLRLGELTGRARRGPTHLTDIEADELIVRYQATSADLSTAQSRIRDPALIATLSRYVADANGVIYRPRAKPAAVLADFFRVRVPGAIWSSRRPILVATVLFLGIAFAAGVWIANDQNARDELIPPETQDLLVASEFADYYKSDAAQNFASTVTVNNIRVAFIAYITGALAGIPTIIVLANNAVSIGIVGGVMHHHGAAAQFWGLITPHGLLEIGSILVAGGLGMHLGWALIAAGDAPRRVTFSKVALRTVDAVVGLILAFAAAGLIEGFVTPSGLPTVVRVGIGVLALLGPIVYVVTLGPDAEAELDLRGSTRYLESTRYKAPDALASR